MSGMDIAKKIAASPRAAYITKKMWRELCSACKEQARLKPSMKVQEYCKDCQPNVLKRMKELQEALK